MMPKKQSVSSQEMQNSRCSNRNASYSCEARMTPITRPCLTRVGTRYRRTNSTLNPRLPRQRIRALVDLRRAKKLVFQQIAVDPIITLGYTVGDRDRQVKDSIIVGPIPEERLVHGDVVCPTRRVL